MSAYNLEKVEAIVWGITHEEDALNVYKGKGATVTDTGTCSKGVTAISISIISD